MGRGGYAVARVAVIVRAPACWLWWPGVLAAGIGAAVPGLTGRRIGVLAGAVLFLAAAAVAFTARRRRYAELARGASRAGKSVLLQDRAVTARAWRRGRRRWLALAFPAAVASSLVLPAAGGMALAGLGAGLWAKARWLGGLERRTGGLLWVRTEWAGGSPAAKGVRGYLTTGLAAGDAAPGGARRTATAVSAAR
ncbi:hypothetical protein I5Q34_14425 [Streptomyces sp. AV19]|uniref:hypothetical protein n=1 Tax=Streptomyces sp. AV19 TaxID=2793068 RepID=UPI0018FE5EB7|nr:hypothetical protein [Streptomyces sp. AV19]MBH1935454.1 hypothetical protein [Streptomyces sp. AV19]MDG4531340.1 hypothetical protein [Streptomyces sp. AV19]